jgi:NADH:ubiquinone oxidoreductase subunit 3 (subunit A)
MAAFTSIAAGVGLAVTAATTVGSFAQASEQNSKKKKAEEAAAKAMTEARKKLDVNYY